MVLGALGYINNSNFEKKISAPHIAIRVHFSISVAPTSMKFYADEGLRLKSYGWAVFLSVSACNSSGVHPILYDA